MEITADELISELRRQISDLSFQLVVASLRLRKLEAAVLVPEAEPVKDDGKIS